jgi:RNA polymerase sigma-70 factor (ECF subfamily)
MTAMLTAAENTEKASLENLIRTHQGTLLAYATRLTGGDRHRAEDALQEVWLRAWRHLDRLVENYGSVYGWLLRVTHNVVIDQHRHRAARATEVELDSRPDAEGPADQHDEALDALVVGEVLASLGEPHRAAVVECYLRDRTAAQAAIVLGVPRGTIKSRLHYALRALRETLSSPEIETWSLAAA